MACSTGHVLYAFCAPKGIFFYTTCSQGVCYFVCLVISSCRGYLACSGKMEPGNSERMEAVVKLKSLYYLTVLTVDKLFIR